MAHISTSYNTGIKENICREDLLYVTGSVNAVQSQLMKAINDLGVNTCAFTYTLRHMKNINSKTIGDVHYKGISVFRGPLFFINRLQKACDFFQKNFDYKFIKYLHANMLFTDGYICRYLHNKFKIPYVVTVRNTDLNLWFYWKLPWIKSMGIQNLKEASAVVCLNNSYKNELLRRLPNEIKESIITKLHVIPNGIDYFWISNVYIKRPALNSKIRFITVGRIEPNKNQVKAAMAIDKFRKENSFHVTYTLVGDCLSQAMLGELKKFEFVTIKRFMPKEMLIHEYRESDIFIMPSHKETFGLVYAEAMTQGLPVLYTKGQGFDQQFDDGLVGVPVDSNDVESIKKGIISVINNYERNSKNAICCCKRFSWDLIGKALLKVYRNI